MIQLWSVATGQPIFSSLLETSLVSYLAFSHDGALLAAAMQDATIHLWNTATGQSAGSLLVGHKDAISQVVFSPDNHTLASSSADASVNLWDIVSGKRIMSLNGDAQSKVSVTFSADGKTVSSGSSNGDILFWNVKTYNPISQELASAPIPLHSPLFSPDGTEIFFGRQDGKIEIQSLKTDSPPAFLDTTSVPLSGPRKESFLFSIHSLALDQDGTLLAAGRLDGTILLWNVSRKQLMGHVIHPHLLDHIQLSRDGRVLVSNDSDGTVIIWDTTRLKSLAQFTKVHDGVIQPPAVALSLDGKLLALAVCASVQGSDCSQQTIRIWNIPLKAFSMQSSGPLVLLGSLVFSPDNRYLASISAASAPAAAPEIAVWVLRKQVLLAKTLPLPQAVDSQNRYAQLAFSGDGKTLLSYTPFGQLFSFVLWHLEGAGFALFSDPIQLAAVGQGDMSVSFDGRQLISTHIIKSTGLLLVWNSSLSGWQEKACEIAQRNLDSSEWVQYGNNEPKLKTLCP
jgi:WD40 repeat protein